MDLKAYTRLGDVDQISAPTAAQKRRQKQAEDIAISVKQVHWHAYADASAEPGGIGHSHADNAIGHVHESISADRALGPSKAEAPPISREFADEWQRLLSAPRGPLVEWRMRLFCGHIAIASAHATYKDVQLAFNSRRRACDECGLSPATIIAAEAIRQIPAEKRPRELPPVVAARTAPESELKALRREVKRLRREVDGLRAAHAAER